MILSHRRKQIGQIALGVASSWFSTSRTAGYVRDHSRPYPARQLEGTDGVVGIHVTAEVSHCNVSVYFLSSDI